jgi:hypothetical protein
LYGYHLLIKKNLTLPESRNKINSWNGKLLPVQLPSPTSGYKQASSLRRITVHRRKRVVIPNLMFHSRMLAAIIVMGSIKPIVTGSLPFGDRRYDETSRKRGHIGGHPLLSI